MYTLYTHESIPYTRQPQQPQQPQQGVDCNELT
jgi:hypothetical protein